MSANPSLRSAVVLVEDTATGSSLIAHVSTMDVVDGAHLRAHMSEVLPQHLVPARIVLYDRLPSPHTDNDGTSRSTRGRSRRSFSTLA